MATHKPKSGFRPASTLKQRKQRALAWKLLQVTGMIGSMYTFRDMGPELDIIAQEARARLERIEKILRHRLSNIT